MKEIHIKGLHPRYKCYYDGNTLEIYNEKGIKLGSKHFYNSEQTSYCLYCEDGKRRSFYTLRLLYAFTNNISVLDIPKGCIYREKYGLAFYNKRRNPKLNRKPLNETEIENIQEYLDKLSQFWDIIKQAIITQDLNTISNILMEHKQDVIKRVSYSVGGAKEVIEDCFQDAVEYYLKRLIQPKLKLSITLPKDALVSYTIKRYKTIYKYKKNKYDTNRI